MTNRPENIVQGLAASQRSLNCARCGTAFTCNLSGPCWCAEEVAKLPLPADGEDCLCRDCLRAEADTSTDKPSQPSS